MCTVETAASMILNAKRCIAFTGAGISVESSIPPFRGENGLWNKYDPETFEIQYFLDHPEASWVVIREIFYDLFGEVKPNPAHYALAELEARGLVKAVITQNVDNLHYEAGSKTVHEFHGSLKKLICMDCLHRYDFDAIDLVKLPPACPDCLGLLKPDAVFFGEGIPQAAYTRSMAEAGRADLFILIGTTGEVAPANLIPPMAKRNGAKIIEVNIARSNYTDSITDCFIKGKAAGTMEHLMEMIDIMESRRA